MLTRPTTRCSRGPDEPSRIAAYEWTPLVLCNRPHRLAVWPSVASGPAASLARFALPVRPLNPSSQSAALVMAGFGLRADSLTLWFAHGWPLSTPQQPN